MTGLELGGLMVLVAGSFAATNVDNLILLVVLMGAAPTRRVSVVLGFLSAAACVLAIATLGTLVGTGLDPALLGYFGLLPLGFGIVLLYRRLRGARPEETAAGEARAVARYGAGWLSTFLLMFSNSGDSLAIFFPLLAESDRQALLWEVAVFVTMAVLWAALAWRIADQPGIALQIERTGEKLVPWIMMGAGIYILLNTASDTLA
jgi:cadmium resistance protein CadD (predicted permease)